MPSFSSITAVFSLIAVAAAQAPAPTLSINPNLPQSAPTGPGGFVIPSLKAITASAPLESGIAIDTTYPSGAQPTHIPGAPAIPQTPKGGVGYPALDQIPPVDSPEVKQWISQINWNAVPTFSKTTGECAGSPEASNDKSRCWWTCGGCTRATDITECPDKYTWGTSFDDGPSPFTPLLLNYLNEQNVTTTFFVVGSRVVSYPEILISEYMAGHQLSIHTWSHRALTSLTNEQIVAELGWTKKAIKDVVGVTPNTFRPPYGDIDDRVRAIAAQMGLTPIMWSAYKGNTFDTTDWHIIGGGATGESSLSRFQQILDEYAPKLDKGFIVLQHDLYQQTVDLAVGYILPLAIQSKRYVLSSIIDCLHLPLSEAYIETSTNNTATLIPSGTAPVYQASVGAQGANPVKPTSVQGGPSRTSATGAASTGRNSSVDAIKDQAQSSGVRTGASFAVVLGAIIAATFA